MDKWQKRMEKVTANAVHRALQNQKQELRKYLDDIGFPSDVEVARIIRHSAKPVVDAFISRSQTTIERYYNETGKKGPKPLVGLDWNLPTRPEKIYLEALEGLHLSQNKGSITETTEERVKKLVTSGIKQGHSPQEISKNIENLDPQVFSKNRADLIAINQIGKAKQYGEWVANKEYSDAGYLTLKYWSTVNDNRVTRSHTANQNQGWIHIDKSFSGTGDKIAPASNNPRCRCAIQYEIGNKIGEKQPKDIEQKYESGQIKEGIATYFSSTKANYKYENDIHMQNSMTNWQGGSAEYFQKLSGNMLTEEESIALWWWKSERYADINNELKAGIMDGKFAGMILNLETAVYALPRYYKPVFHGTNDPEILKKLENLEEGGIFAPLEFFPTAKTKRKASDFGDTFIKINNPKTGGDLGKIDEETLEELEVLFTPHLTLEFVKKIGNTFIFNEI